MDEATIRNQAFFYAKDIVSYSDPMPSLDEILEKAARIAKFIEEGISG